MKVVKILLAVLGSLLGLLVVAGAVLVWLFDPNDYKAYLADWVAERTGRSIEIRDDLNLSFFPWLAVETGGITVGNAAGFGEQNFATVERASARVKLWPLFRRQVEIGTIALDGVQLDLARNADGGTNWDDLLSPAATDTGDPDPDLDASAGPDLASFGIEGIRIRGGRVLWRENASDVSYIISDLRFETGVISIDAPIDIELELGALDVASQFALDLAGELTARLLPGGGFQAQGLELRFGLTDARSVARARGTLESAGIEASPDGIIALGATAIAARVLETPVGREQIDVRVNLQGANFDRSAQSVNVDGLTTVFDGIEARWRLTAEAVLDEPQLAGAVNIESAGVAAVADMLELTLPAGVNRNNLGNFSLSGNFRGALGNRQFVFDDVAASVLGMQLQGRATVNGADRATARIDIPSFAVGEPLRAILSSTLPSDIDARALDRLAFRGAIDANLQTNAISIADMSADLLGATVTGELGFEPAANGTVVRGTLKSTRFASGPFAQAFAAILTDTVDPRELGTMSFDTRFVYDTANDSLNLDPLAAEVFGLSATGRLAASTISTAPAFRGNAVVANFPPRELFRRFGQVPPQASDDTVLRNARIETRFDITPALGRFDELLLVLDDTRFTGSFVVDDFDNPSYRFDLTGDRLDVDRYLPPPVEQAEAGERVAGDIELSEDALNAIRISGRAQVGDLKLAGLNFQQVSTEVDFGAGKADIRSARARLYGGEFAGALNVDTTGELPTMTLSGQATTLALEPLIEALVGGEANFSGTGNFDLRLTGRGPTIADTVASAGGTMSFSLQNGVISGFNLGGTLCQVYNTQQRLPGPPTLPKETRYELISGAAQVDAGIATTPNLLARTPFMDITGRGRLTLIDQQLDYTLESKLTRSLGIQNCDSLDRMIGDSFPWTLKGTVTEAAILPDFSKYLRQRVEDEVRDRVRERLEDRLRNLL